ncbi:hypothetical protein JI721_02945 [Alicyclobacillus cycloheptanicus]|uniref:Uncharacterized protein n=1 Tax=Alicyclobacillus cycloheptanicus TaxID=1457 RepID=A0ABT9XJY3_9BACL|nr:hypothetical protein [Alicyclobacillus cycloheptanicus]MDQ0190616.1 hypothetical protein [Alicyclobacillus cycloheptanicus]WDM01819.1 hypothetical protein JI721_02945 [Alicyclobacillus cycloheptanicus]
MPVSASKVYLYAAVQGDYVKCFAAADAAGIPYSNVIGEFSKAWGLVQDGSNLVIAVGGAALYALYYNECGWSNPSGQAGGHTPFETFPSGRGVDTPKANYFVNAAGFTSLDSLKLAVMMAYYAVHGTFPAHWNNLPTQETPKKVCVSNSSPTLSGGFTGGGAASTTAPAPATKTGRPAPNTQASAGVGVYASFTSTTEVQKALQMGWKGIAATGALGTKSAPYTQELSSNMDKLISDVLSEGNYNVWWLSFWTVSWPAGGDSFYEGGYKAGQYAGKTILSYKGKVLPNAIVIDPEGYNTPATTSTEWSDWIRGWADGLAEVDANLRPGFYCNQYQYKTYNLASINLPAYIAVSPIEGNTPEVKGGNVEGYDAYYATCPATADVNRVQSWGGKYSTVQFRDSGVDCAP